MRIVVTGSRDFADNNLLAAVLNALWDQRTALAIIEGECPYGGADLLARQWAEGLAEDEWPVTVEPFPPASRTAVHYHARNRAMVDTLGPDDLVVAFTNKPLAESLGTNYTIKYARSKGIRTVVLEIVQPEQVA